MRVSNIFILILCSFLLGTSVVAAAGSKFDNIGLAERTQPDKVSGGLNTPETYFTVDIATSAEDTILFWTDDDDTDESQDENGGKSSVLYLSGEDTTNLVNKLRRVDEVNAFVHASTHEPNTPLYISHRVLRI